MANAYLSGINDGNSSNGISQTDADNRYLKLTGGTIANSDYTLNITPNSLQFSTTGVEFNASGILNLSTVGQNRGVIKGLAAPTQDDYAANKAYVDNAMSNLPLTELNTVVSPRMGGDAISIVDLNDEVIDISNSNNPVIYFQYQNSALSELLNNSIEHIAEAYDIYLDLDSAPIEKYPLYKLPEPIYSTQDSSSTAIYYSSGTITLEIEGNSCATFVVFAGKVVKISEGILPYDCLIFINLNLGGYL